MEIQRKSKLSSEEKISSLEELMNYNAKRYQQFIAKPFFEIIADGTLNNNRRRAKFLNALQIFSDNFQYVMFTRQATCRDEHYSPVFLSHLKDEIGHDDLLRKREHVKAEKDPILKAISAWFSYQMFILDNVEKAAIVHLVLETTGDYYHNFARAKLAEAVNSDYYEVHAVHDSDHAEMGIELIKTAGLKTYYRLHEIIEEAWNMMDAMVDRVYELVIKEKIEEEDAIPA